MKKLKLFHFGKLLHFLMHIVYVGPWYCFENRALLQKLCVIGWHLAFNLFFYWNQAGLYAVEKRSRIRDSHSLCDGFRVKHLPEEDPKRVDIGSGSGFLCCPYLRTGINVKVSFILNAMRDVVLRFGPAEIAQLDHHLAATQRHLKRELLVHLEMITKVQNSMLLLAYTYKKDSY